MRLFKNLFNKDCSNPTGQKLSTLRSLSGRSLHFEELEERQLLAVVTGVPFLTAETLVSDGTIIAAQAPMPTSATAELATPTNLEASSVKKDSILVTWNSVDHAESYEIQYKTNTSTEWTKAGETPKTSEGTISFSLDNLLNDTTYDIRVKALPVSGSVDYTSSDYATMTQKTMVPLQTPTNFNAVYHDNNKSITLTWDPIGNSYTGQYMVSVYQGEKELLGSQLHTNDLADSTCTFTCFTYNAQGDPEYYFTPNTKYTFTIIAQSKQTDYDDSYIAETSLTTPKEPLGTPTIDTNNTYAESSTAIYVTWEGDAAAYYYLVEYRVSETETWKPLTTEAMKLRISGLSSGTTYEVQVTSKANPDGSGDFTDSAPSDVYSLTTFTQLAAPTNLTVTEVADHSISFSWESVEYADGYTVSCYREDFPQKLITTDVQDTTYTFSNLDSNTNYSIWVCATNTDTTKYEQSEPSDKLELKTLKTTLTAPENFQSTARDLNSVTLDWNNVGNADHYLIEYRYKGDTSGTWSQKEANLTKTTIDSLVSGRDYEFRIYSIADPDGDFIDSASSGCISVKTLAKIDTPWNFKVRDKSCDYIVLQWAQITNPLVTNYEVA